MCLCKNSPSFILVGWIYTMFSTFIVLYVTTSSLFQLVKRNGIWFTFVPWYEFTILNIILALLYNIVRLVLPSSYLASQKIGMRVRLQLSKGWVLIRGNLISEFLPLILIYPVSRWKGKQRKRKDGGQREAESTFPTVGRRRCDL